MKYSDDGLSIVRLFVPTADNIHADLFFAAVDPPAAAAAAAAAAAGDIHDGKQGVNNT